MFRDPIEKENSNLSVCPRPKRCSEWQCLFLSIADLRLMGVRAGRQVGFCFWQSSLCLCCDRMEAAVWGGCTDLLSSTLEQVRFSSCCICVSTCVCEEEPGLSAFSKRNDPSELYVLRHNLASTLVCPVTCHYVTFPLGVPISRWAWTWLLLKVGRALREPATNGRVRSGKYVFFCSVPEGEYWKQWKQN